MLAAVALGHEVSELRLKEQLHLEALRGGLCKEAQLCELYLAHAISGRGVALAHKRVLRPLKAVPAHHGGLAERLEVAQVRGMMVVALAANAYARDQEGKLDRHDDGALCVSLPPASLCMLAT